MLWLQSFKGRLVLSSGMLALLLLGITLYTSHLAKESVTEYQSAISRHSAISQQIDDIKFQLQVAEAYIYQSPLLLDKEPPVQLTASLDNSFELVKLLQKDRFIEQNNYLRQAMIRLHSFLTRLQTDSRQLIEVLQSLERRFPGMNILLDTLQPTNNDFRNYNYLAMQDVPDMQDVQDMRENPVKPDKEAVYKLLVDIRYNWAQQISSVRVFIANRSGVFGDPQTSMQSNLNNRDLYSGRVRQLLDELEIYDTKGMLTLVQSDALEAMNRLWKKYERNFAHVKQIVYSDAWRSDLLIVRDRLRPLLTDIWQTIYQIDDKLKQHFNENILESQSTSRTIPTMIWIFTAVVYILILAAYFGFEYGIRRPVLQVAKALDEEGRGGSSELPIKANTEETAVLVSAFQNMQEQVHSRQLRLETILDNVSDGIITFDTNGTIETFNLAAQKLFGYQPDDVQNQNIETLIPREHRSEIQYFLDKYCKSEVQGGGDIGQKFIAQCKDGSQFPMTMKIGSLLVAGKQIYTAIISDASESNAINAHLKNMAERDPLTGIDNRQKFMHKLDNFIRQVSTTGVKKGVFLYLDIDNFNYINDTLGHHAGDRAIIMIAEQLVELTRKQDVLARIGGDEFGILLQDVDTSQAKQIASNYRIMFERLQVIHENMIIDLSCSIGGCEFNENTGSKEELLARADLACHAAKRSGKNRVHFYTHEDEQSLKDMTEDIQWVRKIKQALEQNRMELVYQPIVFTTTGGLSHYEALIRMRDNEDNLIFPASFMSTAERFGMNKDIDAWVIKNAIATLSRLHQQSPDLNFAINLSGASLSDKSTLDVITNEIQRYGLSPSSLTFEITETIAISNLNVAVDFLTTLHDLGCETALDDFGSGYSSFSYLKDLPVDYVKIDGSFVYDIEKNVSHRLIVKSINEVAHAMDKKTIAEFVENEECLKVLKQLGIDYCQGFHIGRPDNIAEENRRMYDCLDIEDNNVIPLFENNS